MATKELQTRLQLKYDTYANWNDETLGENKGANLVLLKGEIGICAIGNTAETGSAEATNNPAVLFKVGDGVTPFKRLKWASALAADVYGWAKSETVVLTEKTETIGEGESAKTVTKQILEFKTGSTVNHSIDLSAFATDTDVKIITDNLAARITTIEGALGTDNGSAGSVSARLDFVEEQLDDILGHEADGDIEAKVGLINQALVDAKEYTDNQIGTAAVGTEGSDGYIAATGIRKEIMDTEASAVASANSYTDGKVSTINADISAVKGRLNVIEGEATVEGSIKQIVAGAVTEVKAYADSAETDAINAAKAYTDGVIGNKAEGETEATGIRGEIAQAELAAKTYTDSAVETIKAKDAAQDTAIQANADAIAAEKTAREQADQSINTKIGNVTEGKDVVTMISDAQTAAVSAAKTETEKQVKSLADNQVATNTTAIAALGKVDETLGSRLDTVEAKLADVANVMDFRGAVEALPESTEGYQDGDVIVVTAGDNSGKEFVVFDGNFVEFGYADGNTVAIGDLQQRMGTIETDVKEAQADISALETAVNKKLSNEDFDILWQAHITDHAETATKITSEIETAVNGEKALREAADTAINNKIGTLPSDYTTVVDGIAKAKKAGEDADAKATAVEGRMTTAEGNITTLQSIVKGYTSEGSIKTAIETAQTAATNAQTAAGDAQTRVGVLETSIPNIKTTAEDAQTRVAAVEGRVNTAETAIVTLQDIISDYTGKGAIKTAIESVTTLAQTGVDNAALAQATADKAQDEVDALETVVTGVKTTADTAAADIANIKADYLKAVDTYIFNCGSSTTVIHEKTVD